MGISSIAWLGLAVSAAGAVAQYSAGQKAADAQERQGQAANRAAEAQERVSNAQREQAIL